MTTRVTQETLFGPKDTLKKKVVSVVKGEPALTVQLPANLRAMGDLRVCDYRDWTSVEVPAVEDNSHDIYHRNIQVLNSAGKPAMLAHAARDASIDLHISPGHTAVIELERFAGYSERLEDREKTRFTIKSVRSR